MGTEKNKFIGFHTGLWAIDYADYPPFPYRAKNWRLELLAPEEKFDLDGEGRRDFPSSGARHLLPESRLGATGRARGLIDPIQLLDAATT